MLDVLFLFLVLRLLFRWTIVFIKISCCLHQCFTFNGFLFISLFKRMIFRPNSMDPMKFVSAFLLWSFLQRISMVHDKTGSFLHYRVLIGCQYFISNLGEIIHNQVWDPWINHLVISYGVRVMNLQIYGYEHRYLLRNWKLYIVRMICTISYHRDLEIRRYIERLHSMEFVIRKEEDITGKQWMVDKSLLVVIKAACSFWLVEVDVACSMGVTRLAIMKGKHINVHCLIQYMWYRVMSKSESLKNP